MSTALSTKILVADADPFRLAIYEQHLRNLGYTNIHAFCGGDNQEDLAQYQGIIFIDISIAANNSYAIIQLIKQFNPQNYIVLITSKEKMPEAEEALKFGAFDLVIKGQYLFTTISEVLANIKQAQEQFNLNAAEAKMDNSLFYVHPGGKIDSFYW